MLVHKGFVRLAWMISVFCPDVLALKTLSIPIAA